MLVDARRDCEDVRVEDDVFRGKTGPLREQPVRPGRDLDLPVGGVRLTLLVERHHHYCRAVAADQPGVLQELGLALLEADGVDDALALDALEPRLDHRPLR